MTVYHGLVEIENYLQDFVLLIVRLYWGWQLVKIGGGKLGKLQQTAKYFQSLGLHWSWLLVILVGFTELLGGLSLIFGLGVRVMMIPVIVVMISALLLAHRDGVRKIFKDPMKLVTQPPMTFLLVALFVLVFGAGMISIDFLLKI
jgi:putative oxidoreductase